MTSMFEQQIKSEPMGFYSVASSRSDGSNSIVTLSDEREELSQQEPQHAQLHQPPPQQHPQEQPPTPMQNIQVQVQNDTSVGADLGINESPNRQSVGQQTAKEGSRSKPQPCKVCGKVLSSASSYYVHMKLHSGNKPYHCTVCEASFCRKPYLEVHMRTHTGERPFQCELCLKRFTQKSSLNTHKRVHTGERPYACDICQKRFAVKSYVTAHRWSHVAEKPLVCERCSLTFTSKSQFAIHIRTHTASTTYECNICGRTFVRDSYLIRHQNRVHRDMSQGTVNHDPPTPQSTGAGTPGTGFESPVCDLRYNEGPSTLDGLAGAKGGIAVEIASLAKQNSLQLPLPLLHPQTTNWCLDGNDDQQQRQVEPLAAASPPFIANSPAHHLHATLQSVYQTAASPDFSRDGSNSQLYRSLEPLDSSHQRAVPPTPGLHPALYLYAQYTNNHTLSYPEYVQHND